MAWTAADVTALKSAIASGVLRVDYADRSVTYKSTDEQLKALALMEREANPSSAHGYRLGSTSKGV